MELTSAATQRSPVRFSVLAGITLPALKHPRVAPPSAAAQPGVPR